MGYELEGVEQIEYEELKNIYKERQEHSPIVLDIRQPEEYNEAHIPGIPLIPMHKIPEVIDEFKKDEEYIFVCRSGNRSQHVALYFKDNGIENVKNFAGGMLAWESQTTSGMERVIENVDELYE